MSLRTRMLLAFGVMVLIPLALLAIGLRQDRKTTRLNSSQRTISYAVFCWKKKLKRFSTSTLDIGPLIPHYLARHLFMPNCRLDNSRLQTISLLLFRLASVRSLTFSSIVWR